MGFRPHTMQWQTQGVEPVYNPETGEYDGETVPGVLVSIPCRFYPGGTRIFKNQDSTDVMQKGSIRLDTGETMPKVNDTVTVLDGASAVVFSGLVQEVNSGTMSQRVKV